jgi:hypothetical protein
MTRSLLYGVVLVFAAAGAALWAASPGCEGRFCLGAGDGPAVQAGLPEPAAPDPVETEELERLWRESQPAGPAAEADEAAPAAPAVAVAEAEAEPAEPGPTEAGLPGLLDPNDPDAAARAAAEPGAMDPEAQAGWAEVAEAALTEPDDAKRGQAIHAIGNLRNAEAVALLSEVATDDPDPGNRLEALQSLWYSAADGLDEDGEIRRLLEAAQSDPDEDIAELAQRALADLDKLEARRTAPPAGQAEGESDG